MKPEKLKEVFRELCMQSSWPETLDSQFTQDKNVCTMALTFRLCRVELVYGVKGDAVSPASVLFSRFYPDKNSPVFLHLQDLLPMLGIEDYHSFYFPYIENRPRMVSCFHALKEQTLTYVPHLERLGQTGGDHALLLKKIRSLGLEDTDPEDALRPDSRQHSWLLIMLGLMENLQLGRYTLDAYYQFQLGNREKALRLYGKLKKKELSAYEEGLYRFLQSPESDGFRPIADACFAQKNLKKVTGFKADFLLLVKSIPVLYLPLSAVFCLLLAVSQWIQSAGTVCYFGVPWPWGFLFGAFPYLIGFLALQRPLCALVNRKNGPMELEFEEIMNQSKGAKKFAMGIFVVTLAASLLFSAFVSTLFMGFYDTHAKYAFDFLQREQFEYADVEKIYYISARHNEWGARIERASYVIALKDGQLIDLDGMTSVKETEEKVLPIFAALGIAVIPLDSDRDLPQI